MAQNGSTRATKLVPSLENEQQLDLDRHPDVRCEAKRRGSKAAGGCHPLERPKLDAVACRLYRALFNPWAKSQQRAAYPFMHVGLPFAVMARPQAWRAGPWTPRTAGTPDSPHPGRTTGQLHLADRRHRSTARRDEAAGHHYGAGS